MQFVHYALCDVHCVCLCVCGIYCLLLLMDFCEPVSLASCPTTGLSQHAVADGLQRKNDSSNFCSIVLCDALVIQHFTSMQGYQNSLNVTTHNSTHLLCTSIHGEKQSVLHCREVHSKWQFTELKLMNSVMCNCVDTYSFSAKNHTEFLMMSFCNLKHVGQ